MNEHVMQCVDVQTSGNEIWECTCCSRCISIQWFPRLTYTVLNAGITQDTLHTGGLLHVPDTLIPWLDVLNSL